MMPPRCAQWTAHPRGPVCPPTAGPRRLVRPLFYPIGGRDCPAWPCDQLLIIGCLRRQDWPPTLERRELARVTPARGGDGRGGERPPPWVAPRRTPLNSPTRRGSQSWLVVDAPQPEISDQRARGAAARAARPAAGRGPAASWPGPARRTGSPSKRTRARGASKGAHAASPGPRRERPAPADCCSASAARSIPCRGCAGRPSAACSRTTLAHRGQQLADPHRRAGPTVVRHQRLQRRR
jgi:hypothetical protein